MVVSKDFRDRIRNLVTQKKIASDGTDLRKVNLSDLAITFDFSQEGEAHNYEELPENINVSELPKSSFSVSEKEEEGRQIGSIISLDPVCQYFDGLTDGEEAKPIIVAAKESQSL
jgi:hypothetical protein